MGGKGWEWERQQEEQGKLTALMCFGMRLSAPLACRSVIEAEALSDLTAKRLAEQHCRDPSALLHDILLLSHTKEQLAQAGQRQHQQQQPMGGIAVQRG